MTEFNNFNKLLCTKKKNLENKENMISYKYNKGGPNMEYVTDASTLASYIIGIYEDKYHKDISPIKLQKALYFTFAYWAGMVGKSKKEKFVEEQINLSPYLFEDEFQAWTYGPVIPSIYNKYKNGELEKTKEAPKEICTDDILRETIDTILYDTFEISDFKLVALSHEDKSWQTNYDEDEENHNRTIKREEILNEYTEKAFG